MAKYKKFVPRKKDYSGLIAILIVIFILLAGVVFTILLFTKNSTGIIDKPSVSVSVPTGGDDIPRTFTTKMSFEGDVEGLKSIDDNEYKRIVSDALNSIGYEKLTSEESTEYVKDEMKKRLSQKLKEADFGDFEIKAIYISDFSEEKYPNTKQKPNSSDVADMFKTPQNKK